MIKGVIFDMDGTLIDSMKVWYNTDRIFLRENGIEPPENISEIMKKKTIKEAADYFIHEFSLDYTQEYVIKRIEELVAEEYRKSIQLKSGVIEFLDFLDKKRIPSCVATATYKSLATAVLKRCGILERFKFILTGEDVKSGKTSPEIYFECAKRLNIECDEILVAEDSLHCIETAVNAGFYTVGVYDSEASADWIKIRRIAHKTVNNIFEISDIIKD